MKKLIVLLIVLLVTLPLPSFASNAVFVDGKWETTFDVPAITQIDTNWVNSSGLPAGVEKWGEGITRITVLSDSDAPANKWTISSTANEWYYNVDLAGEVSSVYGPNNLTVGGVVQELHVYAAGSSCTLGQNCPIESLSTGERGWGDNDTIGFNTVYIYSLTDPDDLTGKTIAFGGFNQSDYVAGDLITEISPAANNPLGDGNGMRFLQGDGNSQGSGAVRVAFSSGQKELWIRWYMRHETGFAWLNMNIDKSIYLFTGSGSFPFEARSYLGYTLLAQGTSDEYQVTTEDAPLGPWGWSDIQGGLVGDGAFHCYEVHIKLDTDSTSATVLGTENGIGHVWIDGVLRAKNENVNWASGVTATKDGVTYFSFENNQAWVQNSKAVYIDYDDIVVVNSSTSTSLQDDGNGNSFIGPINYTPTPPVSSGTTQNGFGSGKWGR